MFYVCTFASGLGMPVKRFLEQDVPGLVVTQQLDGLIEVYCPAREPLVRCGYLNNVFLVLSRSGGRASAPDRMIANALSAARLQTEEGKMPKAKSFRILLSSEGTLCPIDPKDLSALEQKAAQEFGMKADRGRPGMEIWLLSRREGVGYLLARLTRHAAYDRTLRRGELRPDVAALMCRIAGRGESMLDPFAGSGAIAEAWVRLYGAEALAGDADADRVAQMKRRFHDLKADIPVAVRRADFFDEKDGWQAHAYPRIVTDPPWGAGAKIEDLPGFYRAFIMRLGGLLSYGGAAVVLTGAKEEMDQAIRQIPGMVGLSARYDTLINGKKAAIYHFVKSKR